MICPSLFYSLLFILVGVTVACGGDDDCGSAVAAGAMMIQTEWRVAVRGDLRAQPQHQRQSWTPLSAAFLDSWVRAVVCGDSDIGAPSERETVRGRVGMH